MKKICLIFLAFTALFYSCDDSLKGEFDRIEGIYLNNKLRNGVLVDSTQVTFVYEKSDIMEVPVTIQLLGRAASYDRSFNLKVSSENADLGIDYELNNKAELPAGETTVNYIVTLKRTDILQQEIKELLVEISANDNFIIPFAFQMESANEISTTRYRILFSDQFTAPPVCWEALMIGEFSHIKFILICDVLDFDPADFNVAGSISLAQWIFISQQMSSYVTDQESLKASGLPYDERVYNEDGSTVKFKR